ncbi:MAG TPA: hypothetical protein VF658_14585 [Pyrinomonadaceae bacterium]
MRRVYLVAIACLLLLLPASALAQTRQRSTRRSTARPASTQRAQGTGAESMSQARTAGAGRVADQIKVLTRFLYLLGGVAKSIEAADVAAQRNEASPAIIEQTQKSKETVKSSLRNVREGLDKLEIDFRSTPDLQRYYTRLAGVAAGAATAEEQAAANQFDQAGRSLLGVVNRLTDVLLEMR